MHSCTMHIMPVLRRQLHCRVEFKLAILVYNYNYKALHGLAPRCTSPTTVCWWLKSVDVMSAISCGHVSYRGQGPSLMTGALLWLDRGLGLGLYRLHCMTLTAFVMRKNRLVTICVTAATRPKQNTFSTAFEAVNAVSVMQWSRYRVQVQTRGPATAKLLSLNWVLVRGTTQYARASADRRRRPTSATNRQSLERYSMVRDHVEPL